MKKFLIIHFLILFYVSGSDAQDGNYINPKINHIVVLMLENRAFDHIIGHLKLNNSQIDGLWGNETCPYNPKNLSEGSAKVSWDAEDIINGDPDHNLPPTSNQIFGFSETPINPAPMNGFVKQYAHHNRKNKGARIMRMHDWATTPAISTLAEEFMVFDRWYSDLPGPTEPNRMFWHSATSWGASATDHLHLAMGYPQKTIFESLEQGSQALNRTYTWRDYFTDFPTILFFRRLRSLKYIDNFRSIETFKNDALAGDLPTYSFIEPRWFTTGYLQASDQHPPHPVSWGENLIADIYEAVRAGPKWNETLLIITYDEHGGFYDHVPTPQDIPPPDGNRPPDYQPPFNFTRSGVRVPTIFVSPWLNRGTVMHEPDDPNSHFTNSHFTHSSFSGTLKEMLALDNYLTHRDQWAAKWHHIFNSRTEPRTDCPQKVPRPSINIDPTAEEKPISDLQRGIINTAIGLEDPFTLEYFFEEKKANEIGNEKEGSEFVKKQLYKWINKGKNYLSNYNNKNY